MSQEEVNYTIDDLEYSLLVAKEHVAQADAIKRLEENPDFIKMFIKGYGDEEVVRIVRAKAMVPLNEQLKHADFSMQLDAIGNFYEYLRIVKQRSNLAAQAIDETQERINQLRDPDYDDSEYEVV